MPTQHVLDAAQTALLLQLAGLTPLEASPLPPGIAAALDSPEAARLRERGLLLEASDGAPRVNSVFLEVLAAAARPDEVLALRVTGPGMPGFAFARGGRLWTEVATDQAGTTHFAYPLSRAAMIVAAGGALSGTREELPPVGFHFRGPAADALLLSAIASHGAGGVGSSGIADTVRTFIARHSGASASAALADPTGTRALASGETAGPLARLVEAGHVAAIESQVVASRRARAVLGTPPDAGFVASRTLVEDASTHVTAVQFWRCGGRILAVRPVTLADGSAGVDWSDLQKAEARAFVAAIYALDPTAAA